jgi:hypothetical protein
LKDKFTESSGAYVEKLTQKLYHPISFKNDRPYLSFLALTLSPNFVPVTEARSSVRFHKNATGPLK